MYYKQEIYDFLKENRIWYEITEHEAVFNMEELDAVELPYPDADADAKNLFVRDDKRRFYYLITVKGDKPSLTLSSPTSIRRRILIICNYSAPLKSE